MFRSRLAIILPLMAQVAAACGKTGSAPTSACGLCGAMNDLTGSIASESGSQAEMAGWVIVSVEKDTGISRVATVGAAGIYTLSQVDLAARDDGEYHRDLRQLVEDGDARG